MRRSGLMPALLLPALMLLAAPSWAALITIDNVRAWRAPEYTRFVFDVSGVPDYKVLPDIAPGRVVIDFREAQLKAKLDAVDLKDSPVRRVRSGPQAGQGLRVVFDLAVAVRVNSFALAPNAQYGHRLVIDLYDQVPAEGKESAGVVPPEAAAPASPAAVVDAVPATPAAAVEDAAATEKTGAEKPAARPPAPAVPANTTAKTEPLPPAAASKAADKADAPVAPPPPPAAAISGRRVVVAIDAGHGGEDPGAMGPNRTREKDVVLAIARAVRDQMKLEPGMRPVLIRDGDYYVGLRERRTIARKKHDADIFVSIHADAFARREARGASVFAVSRRGATSTLAAYLADSENRADLIGGVDPRAQDDVMSVISDLMLEGTMSHSLHVARSVLDELGDFAHLHKRQVEQAGFMVLKEPNMPSILVETGFISNPEEERLLGSVAYQQRLGKAVVNGVRRYFDRYPPPGTWFAANRDSRQVAAVEPVVRSDDAPPVDVAVTVAADEQQRTWGRAARDKPGAGKKTTGKKPEAGGQAFIRHKVTRGQSLGYIAKKYGVSQAAIKKANKLRRDDVLIGETLKIPQS